MIAEELKNTIHDWGKSGLRSTALLVSVVSVALLSLLGWARHESQRSVATNHAATSSDDEITLFVG